ncbi:metallopeptidase family protein [Microbacterium sp. SD291]|nr:metallopeptidase family protein [Microbacterium sp. SD291]
MRPPLAPLEGRIDRFDLTVGTAVEFLRGTWPELQEVRFEIGAMPASEATEEVPRWYLDRQNRRIVLFRLPIERMLPPGHDDGTHRRMAIESAVFRAAAEYVGREPWDLGHDH